jgi:hypothetical protein
LKATEEGPRHVNNCCCEVVVCDDYRFEDVCHRALLVQMSHATGPKNSFSVGWTPQADVIKPSRKPPTGSAPSDNGAVVLCLHLQIQSPLMDFSS